MGAAGTFPEAQRRRVKGGNVQDGHSAWVYFPGELVTGC